MIELDQSSFSGVERESSKNLRERYNHFRALYVPESKDREYVEILHFIEMRTGECRKGKI